MLQLCWCHCSCDQGLDDERLRKRTKLGAAESTDSEPQVSSVAACDDPKVAEYKALVYKYKASLTIASLHHLSFHLFEVRALLMLYCMICQAPGAVSTGRSSGFQ